MKTLKLKDLKRALDKMSKEDLEKPLLYNSVSYSISGQVTRIGKAKATLYYTGDEDPANLYTKKELIEEGYDKEDIAGFEVEIPRGAFVITI